MVKIRFGNGIWAPRSRTVPRELDRVQQLVVSPSLSFSLPLSFPPSRKDRYDESRTGIPGGNDDARRTRVISGSMNRVYARADAHAREFVHFEYCIADTQYVREESHPISFDKPYAEFIVTK